MTIQETTEFAIAFANKLVEIYPEAKSAQEVTDLAIKDGRFESNDEMLAVWGRLNRLFNKPQCDICNEQDGLMTETDKALFRADYAGIDFYNEICASCFNREKDVR